MLASLYARWTLLLAANFDEKAYSVKGDVAALMVERNDSCVLHYASIRTPIEPALFGDSVHYEIHLFGLSKALQSSHRSVLLLAGGGPSSLAQSPYARDPKRSDTQKPYLRL